MTGLSTRFDLHCIDDRLLVGAAFPCEATRELVEAHGVSAIVDLRAEDCDDERALADHGVAFLHLPTPDHGAVSQPMLRAGVAFASRRMDSGDTVLVHCQHGIGRSALLALCVMVHRGWAPLDALERAKQRRGLLSPSPTQFEGWRRWLDSHAIGRGVCWRAPTFEEFAAIAYRHLRSA